MANQATEKLTGYSKDELVGETCAILNREVCREARPQGDGKWCKVFDVKKLRGKRCLLMRKDGPYVSAVKSACLVHGEDGSLALAAFIDISKHDRKDNRIGQLTRLLRRGGYKGIIGKSPIMRGAFQLIEGTAQRDAPVIIYGETETGKKLVARAIHEAGCGKDRPFIRFNCAAANDSLLDSELFGHKMGAFTGTFKHGAGRFEADTGSSLKSSR